MRNAAFGIPLSEIENQLPEEPRFSISTALRRERCFLISDTDPIRSWHHLRRSGQVTKAANVDEVIYYALDEA